MKVLSLLSLFAFVTLGVSAAIPRVPFTVNLSITAQAQSFETNTSSTTISVPAFTKGTITMKNLLPLIAQDEYNENNYETNTFPTGAKLVFLADPESFEDSSYVVEDKNGDILVDVSDLMSLAPGGDLTIYSYTQSISTGLYKPFVRGYQGVFTFDDSGAGGVVQFSFSQLVIATTTETLSKGILTESCTSKLSAGTGTGTFLGTPAILTVPATTVTGKVSFAVP